MQLAKYHPAQPQGKDSERRRQRRHRLRVFASKLGNLNNEELGQIILDLGLERIGTALDRITRRNRAAT